MEFTARDNIEICKTLLSILAHKIKASNSLNFTDASVAAERFFKGLLNRLFGWNLANINISSPNVASIDLGCSAHRVAVQVTSTTGAAKIRATAKGFAQRSHQNSYDRLIFVYPTMDRPNLKTDVSRDFPPGFAFNPSQDVLSFRDVLRMIYDLETGEQERIVEFLRKELRPLNEELGRRIGKDLTTDRIYDLILHLSRPVPEVAITGDDDPAPDEKLRLLHAHAYYLVAQWHYAEGHQCIREAKKQIGYDGIHALRSASRLKAMSSEALRKHAGNAKDAFEEIVAQLQRELGASGRDYESSAVRYFLASEFQACNVFPIDTIKQCVG